MLCGSRAALFSRWGRFNKAWSDPRGMARTPGPRPDRSETCPSLERGSRDLCSHRDPGTPHGAKREPRMVWLQFLPKLGKAPGLIPARGSPAGLWSQGQARAIGFGTLFWPESFPRAGKKWHRGLSGSDRSPRRWQTAPQDRLVSASFPSIAKVQTFHFRYTYCVPGCSGLIFL